MIDLGKLYECSYCKHKFLASESDISINKVLTFGVNKVMILHQNTEYKRKELPIKPTREELEL